MVNRRSTPTTQTSTQTAEHQTELNKILEQLDKAKAELALANTRENRAAVRRAENRLWRYMST